jgi:integrase
MARVKQNKPTETVVKQSKSINTDNLSLDIVKSVRCFEKNGNINLDYTVHTQYIKDNKSRIRFSTGIKVTKRALQQIERNKHQLAIEHYLKNNTIKSDIVYFKDIALEAICEDEHNRTKSTQAEYISMYKREIASVFDDMIIEDIKVSHIKTWMKNLLEKRPMSRARYVKHHRVMNFIFKFAFMNEYINKNTMDLVEIKSNLFVESTKDKSKMYYTKDEVNLMIENATGWFKVMLQVLLHTGMRTGEAIPLRFSDINYEDNTIFLQRSKRNGELVNRLKTQKSATIRMSNELKNIILNYQKTTTNEWLFPSSRTQKPYYGSGSITKTYFKPLLERLGIEYKTIQATRSTYASLLFAEEVPMVYVQRQLRHKQLSTTMDIYTRNGLINTSNMEDYESRIFA